TDSAQVGHADLIGPQAELETFGITEQYFAHQFAGVLERTPDVFALALPDQRLDLLLVMALTLLIGTAGRRIQWRVIALVQGDTALEHAVILEGKAHAGELGALEPL